MVDTDRPTEIEVRAALARIRASTSFRAAPRLTAFVQFVVECVLAGQGHRIKGYTVAVEALGREPDFDPQADPIVRVEAGRVRRALARFYAREGRDDPIVIELAPGSYVPTVRRRMPDPAHAAESDLDAVHRVCSHLISLCRLQLRAIAAEVEIAETMLARTHALGDGQACRAPPPLLPTSPSSASDAARTGDGRQVRKIQQAESPIAARPRRSRAG